MNKSHIVSQGLSTNQAVSAIMSGARVRHEGMQDGSYYQLADDGRLSLIYEDAARRTEMFDVPLPMGERLFWSAVLEVEVLFDAYSENEPPPTEAPTEQAMPVFVAQAPRRFEASRVEAPEESGGEVLGSGLSFPAALVLLSLDPKKNRAIRTTAAGPEIAIRKDRVGYCFSTEGGLMWDSGDGDRPGYIEDSGDYFAGEDWLVWSFK